MVMLLPSIRRERDARKSLATMLYDTFPNDTRISTFNARAALAPLAHYYSVCMFLTAEIAQVRRVRDVLELDVDRFAGR